MFNKYLISLLDLLQNRMNRYNIVLLYNLLNYLSQRIHYITYLKLLDSSLSGLKARLIVKIICCSCVHLRTVLGIIISSMNNILRCKLLFSLIGLALFVMGLTPVGAASANISHSYGSSVTITTGSLVSLDPLHTNFVVPANTDNGLQLLGVAVNSKDSLLAVDSTSATGSIQVATSGTVNTLVSDVNGDINVGDQVSVSPFNGVGMKAVEGNQLIGLAQSAFTSKSADKTIEKVTDKTGKSTQVNVGYVTLGIAIGSVPSTSGGAKLNAIQQVVKSLTGHAISTFRATLALIVALSASVALVVLIYASIYGGIISIGRNPLAKYAVFRSLISVLGMAGLTALVALGTVYLLVR